MTVSTRRMPPSILLRIFLIVTILEGSVVLFGFFLVPSDIENAAIGGYSLTRILLAGLVLLMLILFTFVLIQLGRRNPEKQARQARFLTWLRQPVLYSVVQTTLIAVFISFIAALVIYYLPATQRLFPMIKEFSIFKPLGDRAGWLMIWICLITYKVWILNSINARETIKRVPINFSSKAAISLGTVTFILAVFYGAALLIHQSGTAKSIYYLGVGTVSLMVWFGLWAFLETKFSWVHRNATLFECISIWLVVFIVSIQVASWFGALQTPINNSFILLADAFLHGRIDLINPQNTYDLTFFGEKWYVPFPPFPAILMIPLVAIFGVEGVNTTILTIALAALGDVTLFLILDSMKKQGWIKLDKSGILWIVALFAFGTVMWWLSSVSNSSFTSQIVTTLMITLSFIATMRRRPAWLSGLFTAGAILSRPNTFVIWPALALMMVQLQKDQGNNLSWGSFFRWTLGSIAPATIGVIGLLYYNYVRFSNPLDFGYATVNGAEWLVGNARKYGVFSSHFIPINLKTMFVNVQTNIIAQCNYFLPRGQGVAIFFFSPAFLYIFRKFKRSLWYVGCWISVLLSITILSLYHNNGAIQITYRYISDFLVPVVMILAGNAENRISTSFKVLISISILISYYGIVSWFRGPC